MGLFDFFRKSKRQPPSSNVSLPQLCYDVAYRVLPHYAYKDLEKLIAIYLDTPTMAGPFFYLIACQVRGVEPEDDAVRSFKWHHGQFDTDCTYFALEYPFPPPIDLSDMTPEQISEAANPIVLAPHFSVILKGKDVRYYILGQAPMGGGTTIRFVRPDGANYNLGPGPAPQLKEFLDAIREKESVA